ncbi:MAG TPA: serine O-acetyltransferase EpsC [Polyangiaceae bacterium]|jgi:serine O-acetyltransferase|nr:serine O-acetyltransferase EpsC [Polyangiaceae bacterium]
MAGKPSSETNQALDALVESYDAGREIDNLESAALPNRRALIEALHHIEPMLYMGFYSRKPLSRENLREAIAEHLTPAREILCDQLRRAVTYEQRRGQLLLPDGTDFVEHVVSQLLQSLPALRDVLNEDVLAAFDGDPAAKSVEEVVFSYPGIRAITAHRIAHWLHKAGVPMVPRIISEYAHSETGIDIHAGAQIGEGFFVDHGTGVVIGETAQIGRRVKLYQGVTLGALSVSRSKGSEPAGKRHPTVEDNVTIYAGARILGGETVIGHDSVIGGNMWIVKSVPPYSKIFGRSASEAVEADQG